MLTNFPNGLSSFGVPVIGNLPFPYGTGKVIIVDGSHGGNPYAGENVVGTLAGALEQAGAGDVILVQPKLISDGDTDPGSYAESNLVISPDQENLAIIGVSRGQTQGGCPQIKPGSGSDPIFDVYSGNVMISGLTLNGAGATGGGIRLNSADSAPLSDSFGAYIGGNFFKNLKASGAAATGGAIFWDSEGGSWYPVFENNVFFDCRAGIVLKGTSISVPRMIQILKNRFFSSANTVVDADIYLAGGSGVNGLIVDGNVFGTVDVPAYATSPTAARYLDLTQAVNGILSNNVFACVGKTFGAAGNAAKIPTTVRMAANYQEDAIITRT